MDHGTRDELLSHLAEAVGSVTVAYPTRVAIDGPPAAGKTTLADELAVVLRAQGRDVIRATIEDFLTPRSQRYRRGEDSAEGCYHDSFDFGALHRVLLDPLGPGGDRRYRQAVYDKATDAALSEPVRTAPAGAVLLFDGVFLLRQELADRWDLRIFVSVPFEKTLDRARTRDQNPVQVRRRGRAALPQPLHALPAVLLRHSPPGRTRRHHRPQRRSPAAGLGGTDITRVRQAPSASHRCPRT